MASNVGEFLTAKLKTRDIGQAVEEMVSMFKNQRSSFEKRWYDNNFFDDGYHFRFLSKSTGKIVDLSQKSSIYTPLRVIPKASKQIRGVVNLITQPDFVPVIFPERITKANFEDPKEYEQARQRAKTIAKKVGHWMTEEWDDQEISDWKAPFMGILTAKHGISYLQVWPDAIEEKIKTKVYDAFDIYLMGNLTSIYDSPAIIKGVPQLISKMKANENFDEDQLKKIHPDNRYASSEIKEAYMGSRFGKETKHDAAATLILKEAFIKEYINKENVERIRKQKDADKVLSGKDIGSPIIRQVFSAGGVWLRDKYTSLPEYPFVDLRFEPGQIYQVPMIERFKSTNKSLDSVVSRLERYIHTMTVGTWMRRRGEQWKINNLAGGQVIDYDATPPIQGRMATVPQHVFSFITFLNTVMEEQGVSTSTLGKIPAGVKANAAIESLKQSEQSSQTIALKQMKKAMKTISVKFLEIADNYFVKPQEVSYLEKGEPTYFDIIGQRGIDGRKEMGIEVDENVIPLKKDYKVKIEMQSGLGLTVEGKRDSMFKLSEYMGTMAERGLLSPEAVKVVIEKLLETYEFGSTAEFMEAMDQAQPDLTEEQIMQIKIAVAEVIKDSGLADKDPEARIEETKVGVVEAMRDIKKSGAEQEKGSREVQRTETVETGKDGRKTKKEVKIIQKEE